MHNLEWKKQARADLLKIVKHIAEGSPPDAAEHLADTCDIEVTGSTHFAVVTPA